MAFLRNHRWLAKKYDERGARLTRAKYLICTIWTRWLHTSVRYGTFYQHHFVDRAAPIVSRLFGQISRAFLNNEYVTVGNYWFVKL